MAQSSPDVKRRALVRNLIAEMIKEGIEITHAVMEGYEFPYTIGRYRPDVIGVYPDGQGVVGIVRMGGEDIDSAAGRQGLKDLAVRISPTKDKSIPLYIAIPARVYDDLVEILEQIKLATPIREEKKVVKVIFDKNIDIRIRTY